MEPKFHSEKYKKWFYQQIAQCGDAEWTSTGVDLVLKNAQDNATARFEQLVDFFASIDAPHLRDGNLKAMFDAGFETPESIIELTQEDMSSLLGSPVMGRKVFLGLRDALTDIPLYKLMGSHASFGRGIGVRKMKKLYESFAGDMSLCANPQRILLVEGFEEKSAKKVVAGYPVFLKFLAQIQRYVTLAKFVEKKQGSMTGQSVVFTGFRSKDLEKIIEDQGGKMSTSVSKNTTLVVAEDKDSTSGKAVKARELGVKVIGPDELNKLLGL